MHASDGLDVDRVVDVVRDGNRSGVGTQGAGAATSHITKPTMLAGLSGRRYRTALEPVFAAASGISAVGRRGGRFITTTAERLGEFAPGL